MLYQFESTLFQAEFLEKFPSIEEQPFFYKYRARTLLQQLLQKTQDPLQQAIIHYQLGVNYLDCEENGESRKNMAKSLQLFSQIENIENYLTYIQSIYNHLGFLAVNLDDNETGLAILAKAERLGEYLIAKADLKKTAFKIQGGFEKAQEFYTITLFYIAQAYTKLGIKDKAAYYCGQTMLRQFKSKTYELRDFVINCISLSEYYSGVMNFAQAFYLLLVGEAVIPEGKRKKLRATLQMAQGKVIADMMSYCVDCIKSNQQNDPSLSKLFNKYSITFDGLNVKQLVFQPSKTFDEIKSLFRQANTLYKKAMSIFVLDGFVTEHIQMLSEISIMYKVIMSLETDPNNIIAFLEKRLDLLLPVFNTINPKAYQNTFEKLLVEVAEINNELYEFIVKFNEIDDFSGGKSKKLTDKMNKACLNTIQYYEKIVEQLKLLEEKQRDSAYYSSITTAYFNIAKAQSKYYSKDNKIKVSYLVNSLNQYKQLVQFINQQNQQNEFQAVLQICKEMISILPSKIDRINYM
ncbi:unnamed protein product [Paramecium sonneborni]|uniref:KIF-binding protein n=1 Tax=Paramecium sonneborni TaxID=65129 RepID=A0A8S1KUX5_9CILI|nr:unnamed protein product [Paramecium sonneborni]